MTRRFSPFPRVLGLFAAGHPPLRRSSSGFRGFMRIRRRALLSCSAVKLFIFIGVNVFGALGWWLGEQFGDGWAIILGGLGSIFGVYVGWAAARRLFGDG